MPKQAPIYDLVLLLDPAAEDKQRKKILVDVEKILSSNAASTVGTHDWGKRRTAYEIDKKNEAEYHLIQFQGPATVPAALDRVLRITDGVLRHRVVKLDPGTPGPPDLRAAAPPPAPEARPAPEPETPAAPAPVSTPEAASEPAATPEPEVVAETEPAVAEVAAEAPSDDAS
jgi:small subunit ribosomal protein S6